MGHSLGGALAALNSLVLALCDDVAKVTVFTVGCPKIFCKSTVDYLDNLRLETVEVRGHAWRTARLSYLNVCHYQARLGVQWWPDVVRHVNWDADTLLLPISFVCVCVCVCVCVFLSE